MTRSAGRRGGEGAPPGRHRGAERDAAPLGQPGNRASRPGGVPHRGSPCQQVIPGAGRHKAGYDPAVTVSGQAGYAAQAGYLTRPVTAKLGNRTVVDTYVSTAGRPGHIGAHHLEICPKPTRTTEISAPGHVPCGLSWHGQGIPCTTLGLQADSPAHRNGWTRLPGTGLVVDVVRRLVEHRLPELVVAGVTGHPEVPHAPAAFGYGH
jgi:hypothetical protein